jgi:tetratricopeptide (TPR) repeat protein
MSLLLDALRRAEQAKERGAQSDGPDTHASHGIGAHAHEHVHAHPELELSPPIANDEAAATDVASPSLITRDRLPDISQSLEILTDDLLSPPPRVPKDAHRKSNERTSSERAQHRRAGDPAELSSAQQAARRLFEAKEKPHNPHRPFQIMLGVLALIAIGAGAYFWYQLRAPSNVAITIAAPRTMPASASAQSPVEARPVAQTFSVEPMAPITEALPAEPAHRSTPEPTHARASAPLSYDPGPAPGAAPHAAPRTAPTGAVVQTLTLNKSTAPSISAIDQGYAAYERGDWVVAREAYQRALTQSPLNRDALLGMAALDMRSGHYEAAETHYLKALELNPRDALAQSGMISLRGYTDPLASESRLKNLLAQQPEATFLNFALGNQYAAQSRWSEAQQSYFKAYSADADNPDYAFNLAVSLDHLRQGKLAIEYYQKALTLGATRPVSFNKAQIEARLRELTP